MSTEIIWQIRLALLSEPNTIIYICRNTNAMTTTLILYIIILVIGVAVNVEILVLLHNVKDYSRYPVNTIDFFSALYKTIVDWRQVTVSLFLAVAFFALYDPALIITGMIKNIIGYNEFGFIDKMPVTVFHQMNLRGIIIGIILILCYLLSRALLSPFLNELSSRQRHHC